MNGLKSKGNNVESFIQYYLSQVQKKLLKYPVVQHYVSVYKREHSQNVTQTTSYTSGISSVKVTKTHNHQKTQTSSVYQFTLGNKVNQTPSKLLPNYIEVKENDILFMSTSKKQIKVGSVIASKGEGTVYRLNNRNVLKVFHNEKFTTYKMSKIYLLIEYAKTNPLIAYPKEFLKDTNNKLVGYYMPKAEGVPLQAFFEPNSLKKHFPHWSLSQMLKLVLNITNVIEQIHTQNLIVGDLNANNILVKNEHKITVIDTDSFQVEDYPSDVGMIEYTRAIHLGYVEKNGYSTLIKSKYDDIFSLSVILFQLLHTGQLPYNHKNGKDSYLENLKKGYFPYSNNNQELADTPNGCKNQWKMVPQALKDYFCLVFRDKKIVSIKVLQKAIEDSISTICK